MQGKESEFGSSFWETFVRATDAELRHLHNNSIVGKSGFHHPMVAVGVDNVSRRVILISGDGDARSAALAHADIQAAMPSSRVVMARPSPVSLGAAARIITDLLGTVRVGPDELKWLTDASKQEEANGTITEFLKVIPDMVRSVTYRPFASVSLNFVAAWKDIVQQLALVEIKSTETDETSTLQSKEIIPTFDFQRLAAFDPASFDRSLGVCPIPLYDFSDADYEVFQRGVDIESAKDILKDHNIYQYFFPPPDQVALGVVENQNLTASEILERLVQAPQLGHPHGQLEIIDPSTNLNDIVEALQQQGLVVEGEYGYEVTPDGAARRYSVKFKPREGFLAKLSRVISVQLNISSKDFF